MVNTGGLYFLNYLFELQLNNEWRERLHMIVSFFTGLKIDEYST